MSAAAKAAPANPPVAPNAEHALAAIGLLFDPGDVIEIRALDVRRDGIQHGSIHAGYFNVENTQAIASAIRSVDGRAAGVYVVLNKLNPVLLARANNHLKAGLKNTTADADILERRWLYIDADARCPAGISSSDPEHEASVQRAVSIREFLRGRGWPEPIHSDSGNGSHLLYRLPKLPLDRAGELVKRCLQALTARFTDAAVKIDQTTFNAARICKLYGTLARKGDSMPDRPHRRARIIESPEGLDSVPEDAIEELASEAPLPDQPVSKPLRRGPPTSKRFDIEEWLAQSGIEILKLPEAYQGGRKWIIRCPFNPEHSGTSCAIFESANGKPGFKCLHAGCAHNDWRALRRHIEPNHRASETQQCRTAVAEGTVDLLAQPMTDSGNAERILALYGHDIRYCHEMKKFLFYNGQAWMVDNSRKVSHLAKKTARLLFARAADLPEGTEAEKDYRQAVEKFARKSESARGRKDALDCLAAEQEGIPISEIELDPDPWKLNTANGTIDLRTGALQSHRREDLISKVVPVDYDPQALCPRFMQFLDEIMGAGPESGKEQKTRAKEVIGYLQKAFGCAATGKPEKVLFVLYGQGNNGKTTLVEIIRAALGDKAYAGEVNVDSLMARPKEAASNNAINSDLADLRGCRFVSSSEVEQGQRLSLSRVKYLAGLGQIKARRLGQDWVVFRPTHKLFLDCNHKPIITDPNDAIWNRVKCIPFTVTIEKLDTDLPEKLRAELPGILRWIVDGAARYYREGLGDPPAEVQAATESYRQESDGLKDFLEDRCILASGSDAEVWKKNKHWVPVANL